VRLAEIAERVHGEIFGDRDIEITGVAGISEAREGDVTFLSGSRYAKELRTCKASCVIVQEPIPDLSIAQLKVAHPYLAFAKLLEIFYVRPRSSSGVSNDAFVASSARIGENVSILPFVYVADNATIGDRSLIFPFVYIGEETVIGEDCVLFPHVTVRERIRIGNRVIIHANSVIGSDGYGYVFDNGKHHKIPQIGGVVIGDDVEIGSNTSIDRATTGNTVIGTGTKIDNLVQIGHNVTIGNHSLLVAQVGIGGSTRIGDYVTLAGQAGVADHVEIEAGTIIGAQSGIMGKVSRGAYSGTPAIPHREWLKAQAVFAKLPELYKKIKMLEDKIKELEGRNIA